MIFPRNREDLEKRVKLLCDACMATARDRAELYRRREAYFLFGTEMQTPVRHNRLESHLDLVSSFLFAPDHQFFHISAEANSDDAIVQQTIALQDFFNDEFHDAGLSDLFSDAIPWALTFDSMIMKVGWNEVRQGLMAELVAPHNFGVYREDIADINSQQCFCHTYFLDWSASAQVLLRAGRGSDIIKLSVTNEPFVQPFPSLLNRMIITSTSGKNLLGNMMGQINPIYTPLASYQPKVDAPCVQWFELWAWDDDARDWRSFRMCAPDILIDDSEKVVEALKLSKRFQRKPRGRMEGKEEIGRDYYQTSTNLFLPGEHPFTQIVPYGKWNYFWGKAHIDGLIPLQDWMNERLDQIADLLEKQAYPPRVGSGFSGLTDEKMEAFGGSDSFLFDQLPQAQVKELAPQMPPQLFAEFQEIGGMFLEASGLTEAIQGRGEAGVRGRGHARDQRQTGGGRIKKAALRLESSLNRIGDLALKLVMKNCDEKVQPPHEEGQEPERFYPSQVASKMTLRVDGHSHSPLFGDEAREIAVLLKRSGAIDNAQFVRSLNPPSRDNILHGLRQQQRQQQQLMQQHPELLQAMAKGGRKR